MMHLFFSNTSDDEDFITPTASDLCSLNESLMGDFEIENEELITAIQNKKIFRKENTPNVDYVFGNSQFINNETLVQVI